MRLQLVVAFAALAAVAPGLSAGPARAQSFDGTYNATIRCTAFSAEIGAFSQPMSLKIAGSSVTGERAVGRAGQVGAGGTVERWTGTVAPDGTMNMRSQSPSAAAAIDGTFAGRASAEGISMKGNQTLTTSRSGRMGRECTVTAKRA
ncbi:MAG: hypothetical protein JNK67_08595 [Alphaproteobacteria bacterium]|nr:hypothetical protein [Alphaproteobacteria bacterium]